MGLPAQLNQEYTFVLSSIASFVKMHEDGLSAVLVFFLISSG